MTSGVSRRQGGAIWAPSSYLGPIRRFFLRSERDGISPSGPIPLIPGPCRVTVAHGRTRLLMGVRCSRSGHNRPLVDKVLGCVSVESLFLDYSRNWRQIICGMRPALPIIVQAPGRQTANSLGDTWKRRRILDLFTLLLKGHATPTQDAVNMLH